jgi:Mn2+/Fe2+ NRAMP family transporter
MTQRNWLTILGPGILVAATGVGAGDLAAASFTGGQLGVAILWAVIVGAFLKYVLTEGLARWQLATGQTLIQGCITHIGRPFQVFFLIFLLYWSIYVGSALMAACGVAASAIYPLFEDPGRGKFWFGLGHSLVGLALVWRGGFKLFEKVMAGCIGLMFVTVIVTALRLGVDGGDALRGLLLPTIPHWNTDGIPWTVALIGGVGGTLTILCYGYWMEESGRRDVEDISLTRADLGVAYGLTAIFGMAMVIIGSKALTRDGRGATLIVELVATLHTTLGPVGAWIFLLGAWGAFFSSLLGVWQSIPYLFADFYYRSRTGIETPPKLTATLPYRCYLLAIALVPLAVLGGDFKALAKYYSLVGAAFMPFLALALLYLNNSRAMPQAQRNRWRGNTTLVVIVLFFAAVGIQSIWKKFG